jgi:predicted ATPase
VENLEFNSYLEDEILNRIQQWQSDLYISIYKLFGEKDVHLDFNDPIKIFVGENGMGKTTLLNTMYYLLTNNIEQLKEVDFYSVKVKTSNDEITIYRTDLHLADKDEVMRIRHRIRRHLNQEEYHYLYSEIINGDKSLDDFKELFEISIKNRTKYYQQIINDIYEYTQHGHINEEVSQNLKKIKVILKHYFYGKVLYFPTYRRIEEEVHKIGYQLIKNDKNAEQNQPDENELIKFGMDDVNDIFNKITSAITQSAIEGLKKVTGEMLTQLVNNNNNISNEIKKIMKQKEVINVVLERVKNELPTETSKRLKEIILDKRFGEDTTYNEFLLYFLHNFIKIYDKSAYKEESIRQFMGVCNKYLVDKEVKYDEGAVKIGIFRKSNGSDVRLSQLSSGEKQIVSIFARLYLTNEENFVILFDEPELSLSIKWQKMFLVDILNSNKCSFIFSVTHSPFIYNNDLKRFTQPLELLFGGEAIWNE